MPESQQSALCACRWLHLEGQQWDGSHDRPLISDTKKSHENAVYPVQQFPVGGIVRSLHAMKHVIANVVDQFSSRNRNTPRLSRGLTGPDQCQLVETPAKVLGRERMYVEDRLACAGPLARG